MQRQIIHRTTDDDNALLITRCASKPYSNVTISGQSGADSRETFPASSALVLSKPKEAQVKKLHIGAILLSGLVAVPLQAVPGTDDERGLRLCERAAGRLRGLFDKGTATLSSVADQTIRKAAADADRSAGLIRVIGRADYANVVKDELVRDGVPARAIVVVPQKGQPTSGDRRQGEPAGQSTR